MRARGSFHSKSARTLQFQLKRCVNSTDSEVVCKSDEEITEFMKGKYLLLMSNQIRFEPKVFGEESIITESTVAWYRPSVQKQEGIIFEIVRTKLELQDLFVNLDEITELEDTSVFEIKYTGQRPYEKDPNLVTSLIIENNLDQLFISRVGYTSLDLMSDVGGLLGVCLGGLAIIAGIINYDFMSNYLATKLYKIKNN